MEMFGRKKKKENKDVENEVPCPNCGTMLSKDATICYACGLDLKRWKEKQEKDKMSVYMVK
jgi:rRNA maturation endonuclease Nob1